MGSFKIGNKMNLEYVSEVSMQVISYAGLAKSLFMQALQEYKQKNVENGDALMVQGEENLLIAHKSHAELLAKEMNDQESQASMLLIHAEDQLMGAETIKILVEELKELHLK